MFRQTLSVIGISYCFFFYLPQIHSSEIDNHADLMALRVAAAADAARKELAESAGEVTMVVVRLGDGKTDRGYPVGELVKALTKSKIKLMGALQARELAALRAYVNQFYEIPSFELRAPKVWTPNQRTLLTAAEKDRIVNRASTFLAAFRAMVESGLTIDLNVKSQPVENASYDMWPSGGDHLKTSTNNTLDNVYRGYYTYRVTKPGYKTIEEPLNLVDTDKRILDCTLHKTSESDGPSPCKLN